MQPREIEINGIKYQGYDQQDRVYPPAGVPTYALRRVFNLQTNRSKNILFDDLPQTWRLDSLYISSPEDSEIKVEILFQGYSFFEDTLKRNETPKWLPPVIIDPTIAVKVTAYRNNINALLLYLTPVYLAFARDF